MTRRVAKLVVLVVVAGLLIYGGVHRTQAVLANESRETGTVQTQESQGVSDPGSGLGSGQGGGLHDGSGRGRQGGGEAADGSYTE